MKLGDGSTRGPWKISSSSPLEDGPNYYEISFSDGELRSIIARCYSNWICQEHTGSALGNVSLLAKSPLLIECTALLTDLNNWFNVHLKRGTINAGTANKDSDFVSQIRALLAKLDR